VPRRHADNWLGRPEHHPRGLYGVKGRGGKDVEGRSPIYEDTPQLHVANGGGNHHRNLPSPGNARWVVGLVEGEGNLRPPRPTRRLMGRGRGQKLSLHGLKAAAGGVSVRPSVERGDGLLRSLELQVLAIVIVIVGAFFLASPCRLPAEVAGALPSRRFCRLSSLVFLKRSAKFLTVRQSARLCR
jgi:hypothetical protein